MKQRKDFLVGILVGALLVMFLSPNSVLAQSNNISINSMDNIASITVLTVTTLAGLLSLILGLLKSMQIARGTCGFEGLIHPMFMSLLSIFILLVFNFVFDGQWNLGLTLALALNGGVFGGFLLIVCRL